VTAAVVVNPRAGAGAAGRRWPAVARMLQDRIGAVKFHFTSAPGHGLALGRELAVAGFDPVIAAGGDGTLNEVANGILAAGSGTRLGVLPLASAGDFARTLGLSGTLDAIEALAAGRAQPLDAVLVRFHGPGGPAERYFVNAASIGLGAQVARSVGRWPRALPARARYLMAAAGKLAGGRGFHVRFQPDDAPESEFHLTTAALANGRYQGGGVLIAPGAAIDDGEMDCTLVDRVSLTEVAVHVKLLYSGGIYSHPKVHHWRATRVRAEGPAGVPLELDGEPVGELPLEAEVRPRALRLIVPEVR